MLSTNTHTHTHIYSLTDTETGNIKPSRPQPGQKDYRCWQTTVDYPIYNFKQETYKNNKKEMTRKIDIQ